MTTITPLITGFYAGILAILYLALAMNVIRQRRASKVGIGDGKGKFPQLAKTIRVHANFIEYVPLALLMMSFYELNHGQALLLHLIGGALVTARFLHAIGLGKSSGVSWQRFTGTLLTFFTILGLAIVNIFALF